MPEEIPRIERLESPELEDETSHLWAISYADFLMVLLSFFILFFSVTPDKKNETLEAIIETSSLGDRKTAALDQQASPPTPPPTKDTANRKTSLNGLLITNAGDLDGFLKGIKLERTLKRQQVVFLFPDNIYGRGRISPRPGYEKHIREVLTKVLPFKDRIELLFVGHTDDLKYKKPSNRYLEDNFDLSVLRATKALQAAVRLGYAPDQVSAKGSADSQRASRTLSLVLRLRQDP